MIGFGYDIHQLAEGHPLILGGVPIDSPKGTIAHSDGDVLAHAVIDALLGAACLGDIGEHFPDTDAKYKNADSMALMQIVNLMLAENQLKVVNIDVTVVLEAPKLYPYKALIKHNIAKVLNIPSGTVNIKAKTNEQQDSTGQRASVVVYACCQVEKQ